MDQNIHLGKINSKNIEVNFTGGDLTSDTGLLALRNIEEKTKFLKGIASIIPENRQQEKIQHSKYSQIIQRVYGLIPITLNKLANISPFSIASFSNLISFFNEDIPSMYTGINYLVNIFKNPIFQRRTFDYLPSIFTAI